MNISRTTLNPALKQRNDKIAKLQSELSEELNQIDDMVYENIEAYDENGMGFFAEDQRVSTHEAKIDRWKTNGKILAGAIGGAALGYQGGYVGGIGSGALAATGLTFTVLDEGDGFRAEMIPGSVISLGVAGLIGSIGGIPGAVMGGITGALAVTFGKEYYQ